MADYEGRFTKFFKYAPKLVTNERRRIRCFVQGLNVEIQEGLAAAQISTFTEVLEKAQRVESARLQVRDFHAKKRGTPSNPPEQANKGALTFKKKKDREELRQSVHQKGLNQEETTMDEINREEHAQVVKLWLLKLFVVIVASSTIRKMIVGGNKGSACIVVVQSYISKCPTIPKEGGSTQRPEKPAAK